ncbi:uncharacterized protein LOC135927136 isoform X1 [Gordionus sp. m RMFG-2023]|uniref:uncharacterized protein LOC135927136 isoform X1 n=1 Tax=Gordionus sp. m RMFG-2023 TaxID=3053472 RepID=UPI0031FD4C8F
MSTTFARNRIFEELIQNSKQDNIRFLCSWCGSLKEPKVRIKKCSNSLKLSKLSEQFKNKDFLNSKDKHDIKMQQKFCNQLIYSCAQCLNKSVLYYAKPNFQKYAKQNKELHNIKRKNQSILDDKLKLSDSVKKINNAINIDHNIQNPPLFSTPKNITRSSMKKLRNLNLSNNKNKKSKALQKILKNNISSFFNSSYDSCDSPLSRFLNIS